MGTSYATDRWLFQYTLGTIHDTYDMRPLREDEIDALGPRLLPPDGPIAWLGVHPAHSLPTIQEAEKACWERIHLTATDFQPVGAVFVANTDTQDKEGDHWVVFYLPSPYHEAWSHGAYFFDPLGRSPVGNGHADWEDYLLSWSGDYPYSFNPKVVQPTDSAWCGHLCLIWLFHLASNVPFPYGCAMSSDTIRTLFANVYLRSNTLNRPREPMTVDSPYLNIL